jgi:hypothetical protein
MYLHHTVHSYTLIHLVLSVLYIQYMLQAVQGSKYQTSYKYACCHAAPMCSGNLTYDLLDITMGI